MKSRQSLHHDIKKSLTSVSNNKIRIKPFDSSLMLTVVILVVFGLIMVFSASAPAASAYQNTPYYYIIRQGIFAIMGIIAMFVLSYIDYHKYSKFAFLILVGSFVLLFSVYIPGLGVVRNNARRWINIGISTLQPSEVVKVAIIIYFSYSLSLIKDNIKKFKDGLLRYLVVLGLFAVVLLKEPHLSATLVICAVGCVLLLVAGARIRHFLVLVLMALPVLCIMIYKQPYQLERITTFLDPFADKSDAGFQVVNSLYAIGSGGIFGLGLGMSRQKFLYLPEPQNDFIFAIICEELGLLGAVLVLALFGFLIWKGYRIAQEAPDMYGTLLATGITSLIAIQVAVNVAVVTSSVPATGMALPFFSYGGTSLLILLGCMGILLNISRQTVSTIRPYSMKEKSK
ncbi:MAG: putative lipid II flippase FtsW [Clostridia bacterium]|nr:putative lipid II flippase FtsW [Clostridia bacterium]